MIPQSGDVVVSGWEVKGDPWSLFLFSLKDGKLWETKRIKSTCGHKKIAALISSLIIDGREQVVVSCRECNVVKLLDLQTGAWRIAFTSCTSSNPSISCPAGSSRIFVQSGCFMHQLDATSSVFKSSYQTLYPDMRCDTMCYIPPPVEALVLGGSHTERSIVALSIKNVGAVWGLEIEPGSKSLPFHPEHNVLLVANGKGGRVLIVDPNNGLPIQTIELPDMGDIYALSLYKDQIVMLHEVKSRFKISYYKLSG